MKKTNWYTNSSYYHLCFCLLDERVAKPDLLAFVSRNMEIDLRDTNKRRKSVTKAKRSQVCSLVISQKQALIKKFVLSIAL
jgi:hypothetical protein